MIVLLTLALAPSIHSEQLDNGAWIAAVRTPAATVFSAQVFVRSGSIHDTEHGAAHLYEHLLFANGTADALAENAGFMLNATTYREFTRLHATGPSASWLAGVRSLAALLAQPDLNSAASEWRVIRQEASFAALDPDRRVSEALWQAAGGTAWAANPVGGETQPSAESLAAVSSRFHAANLAIVVAVDAEPRDVIADLRAAFAGLSSGTPTQLATPPPFEKIRLQGDGDRVGIAFPAPGYDTPARYAANEAAIETVTSPSRLQAHGLAARAYFGPSARGSLTMLVFHAADGAPGLEARVRRLLSEPPTQPEFLAAQQRLKARYESTNPESQSIVLGLSLLLTGRPMFFAEEAQRLTKADVDTALAEFTPDKVAWSVGR